MDAPIKKVPALPKRKKVSKTTKATKPNMVTLNMKVPVAFRREVKLFAVKHDTTMISVLTKAFLAYKKQNKS